MPPSSQDLSEAKRKLLEQRLRGKAGAVSRPAEKITKRPADAPAIASLGQRRIWFLHQLDPDSPSYNITSSFWVSGQLDPGVLEEAVNRVVDRQQILRSSYCARDGEVVQVRHEKLHIPLEDFTTAPGEDLEAVAEELSRRPMNPEAAPMLRILLVRDRAGRTLLMALIHDLIFDKWSLGLFWKEVAAFYNALQSGQPPAVPDLPVQYADFAHWQRTWLESGVLARQLAYWRNKLSDLPEPLHFPTDHPYPLSLTDAGKLEKFRLAPELTRQLKDFAARESSTLFMVLQLGLKLLVQRYTGEADLVIGSPVANRRHQETADLIGFFLSTVALRTDLSGNPDVREALGRVRQTTLEALENQDAPFDQVVEEVAPPRAPGRYPVFQVMFVYQREEEAAPKVQLAGATLSPTYIETLTSKFDFTLFAAESGDGMELLMEYRTDLFEAETMHRMLRHYQTLLAEMVRDPRQALEEVALVTGDELTNLLDHSRGESTTAAPEPAAPERVAEIANRAAQTPAILSSQGTMDYGTLDAHSDSIAQRLQEAGVAPGQVVALYAARSPAAIAGILGIMRAGAAYLPVDPGYPADRCRFLLDDSGAQVVLADPALTHSPVLKGRQAIALDFVKQATSRYSAPHRDPSDLAYLIYTSGSTGHPKGVKVTCDNLAHSTAARRRYYPEQPGRFLLIPSLSFDSSIAGLFWTLQSGGALVLPEQSEQGDPAALRRLIREHGVTHLLCIPSLYQQLLDWHDPSDGPSTWTALRSVMVAGEPCPPALVKDHYDHLPDLALYNEYGPTEATVWATVHRCTASDAKQRTIPIGRPIPNATVYVVDGHGRLLPEGIPGELMIGGRGVAAGYHHHEELTRERFRTVQFSPGAPERVYATGDLACWRPDGRLEFRGRNDEQVKVRGYRIETGEIEAALKTHRAVNRAAVLAIKDEAGHARLVAFFEADSQQPSPGDPELRQFLSASLPVFLIPSQFVALETLPLMPNGKIDRQALARRSRDLAAAPLPGSADFQVEPEEAQLLQIWRTALGRERIGVHDDFYAVGGDSLLALQIISKAAQAGLRITLGEFFRGPTVAQMAALTRSKSEDHSKSDRKPSAESPGDRPGPVPLTPIQHWFFEREFAGCDRWNLARTLEIPRSVDDATFAEALRALIRHHNALRLSFVKKGGGWLQSLHDRDEPPVLESIDLAGCTAQERLDRTGALVADAHRSMRLDSGSLLRAVRFQSWSDETDLVLLVAHHLVLDVISWSILLEDLETAWRQLERGSPVALTPGGPSFRQWAEALGAYAQSEAARQEADYWRDVCEATTTTLPTDFDGSGGNLEGSRELVTVALDTDLTAKLNDSILPAFRADLLEAMITVLASVVTDWIDAPELTIGLEGHGREEILPGMDLSRTVGWFTSSFPVRLRVDLSAGLIKTLAGVKETLRQIPAKGIGFGILRYLTPDANLTSSLSNCPDPELLFNYHGRLAGPDRNHPADPANASRPSNHWLEDARDPLAVRPAVLEINAHLDRGSLVMHWSYSRTLHRRETIERLAGQALDRLAALAGATAAEVSPNDALSPTDFPEAELDSGDLAKLLGRVD